MSKLVSFYEGGFDRPELGYPGGPVKKLDCDVIVVGGGGSGMSAAARAAERGAKVVLIEKMDILGGNSRLAGGLLSTNSRFQKQAGMPDKTQEYLDTANRLHTYRLDSDLVKRYVGNTGTLFEWLVDNGLDMENTRWVNGCVVMIKTPTMISPVNNPTYGPGLLGSSVTDLLERMVCKSGVTVLKSTKVASLKTNGGAVVGVTADGQGESFDITAGSVIISSGGFGGNPELLARFLPEYFSSDNYITHYCMLSSTGDGLTMAEAIGARVGELISVGLSAMSHHPGAFTLQNLVQQPEGIAVSATGKRFIPEDDMENGVYAMDRQPDGVAWYVFTQKACRELYETAQRNIRFGDVLPEIDQMMSDIEKEIGEGKVVRADTIQELAAGIGAPADVLRGTLEKYERFCAAGHDDDFFKDPKYLKSMGLTGPWYGVRLYRKFDVTMGGVSIDSRLRALRPDRSVIGGLYVTGDIASNWMGTDYGPLFSSFAWALNSGYLAAEECMSKD